MKGEVDWRANRAAWTTGNKVLGMSEPRIARYTNVRI